ncbi:hypothetical protein ACXDF8_25935 [Mycolicibacterium sp. CBM1]
MTDNIDPQVEAEAIPDLTVSDLGPVLQTLTPTQLALVLSMARAMQVPVTVSDTSDSDIIDDVFAETMSNLLTLHHALHEEPLNKKSFEYLFKQCLVASGHPAEINPTPGDESWDIRGAGFKWSLKTEAAKGISAATVKIEKLMEAIWVREATDPDKCAEAVRARINRHMQDYDRIIVLRAFVTTHGYRYDLVEIPKRVLVAHFESAEPQQFQKQGRSISYGADFSNTVGSKVFRILLDSSVEKIRLWYRSDFARVHGRWQVQVEAAQAAQQNTIEA